MMLKSKIETFKKQIIIFSINNILNLIIMFNIYNLNQIDSRFLFFCILFTIKIISKLHWTRLSSLDIAIDH